MSGGRRKAREPNGQGRVIDRLIGVVEAITDGDDRHDEEIEYLAARLADIENRLFVLDGCPGAALAAERARDKMVGARKRKGKAVASLRVAANGRLEFLTKVPQ